VVARSAGIIKFAREEIEFLANGTIEKYVEGLLDGPTRLVVITDGGGPVEYFVRQGRGIIETPGVDVVDTTAAGDAFTAGVLRGICDASNLDALAGELISVESLLSFAAHCGSLTTTRAGAFPSLPVFEEVAQYWVEMP
jgi:fructokinase